MGVRFDDDDDLRMISLVAAIESTDEFLNLAIHYFSKLFSFGLGELEIMKVVSPLETGGSSSVKAGAWVEVRRDGLTEKGGDDGNSRETPEAKGYKTEGMGSTEHPREDQS
ncbi:hypothetical protein TNIN_130831 [Trichonephila inaurata madagascariensis]|uniref:Uncharacterized protein n=1 Tax=Trichonephila inaurata madagascariensis TaxID=2747483 RepID=A0A8X6J8K8_9ARAC|nr:hypothetical protein TNIN_130831 [Trichonephila inaurata madagascariensis]